MWTHTECQGKNIFNSSAQSEHRCLNDAGIVWERSPSYKVSTLPFENGAI